jgi:pimeloyl-ACP methyl ester carboxylesterase
MNQFTHQTVPTQFVEANGIRFAYRRFGKKESVPLVFNQHFTGNLDNWDPAVTDGLARDREIILFDNAGVGGSSGEVPQTFAANVGFQGKTPQGTIRSLWLIGANSTPTRTSPSPGAGGSGISRSSRFSTASPYPTRSAGKNLCV